MPEFLLFRLYAPLASWGDTAVGEFRPTENRPGKSAVAGLLGAALGIGREEEAVHRQLHDGYGLALCTQVEGRLLRDFHTAQVPSSRRATAYRTRREELQADELNTILSTRDYLLDAAHIICLWAKQEAGYSLEELKAALVKPLFSLSLGRRACPPALPLQPQILSAATLKAAFAASVFHRESEFDAIGCEQRAVNYYWEEFAENGFASFQRVRRRDRLVHRGRRQFGDRLEYQAAWEEP